MCRSGSSAVTTGNDVVTNNDNGSVSPEGVNGGHVFTEDGAVDRDRMSQY
ncbi:hypothetical protein HanIR_Chr01g0004241 [Helianthus annuus]|nr:hypothetical protein HanIR_Chr01g0004241 [Helianthus annuus]